MLILLNAVIKPLWIFGIDRRVQNDVGVAAYGTYFSIWNLSYVLLFLLDWGLTVFYNRQLSAKDSSIAEQAGTFVVVKLVFALLYTTIVFGVAFFSGIDSWNIIGYVVFIQVCSSMFVFFRAIITSQQWFRTDAWLSVLDKLLMILLCGTLLYFPSIMGGISIERFLLLQAACMAFAMIVALTLLAVKKFHFSFKKRWPDNYIFKAALPFAIIVLLMSFHSRIDGFLLERISGPEEAGKYAGAFRLLDAANMLGFLFASFLLPYVARQWSEGKEIAGVVLTIRHLLLVAAISLSCIVIFLAPWIQQALYHHTDSRSIEILQWCLPALIGYSLVQVYGTVMAATGNIVAFSYIILISVILNVLINILLIPSWGAKGSCIAALVSQAFSGIATMWYTRQKIKIGIDIRSGVIYIFIGGLICGFLYVSDNWPVNKLLILAGAGMIAAIMLWITRLVDLRNWKISAHQ
ncbi:MAG: polysaccharide biosynthesis C-terminal domain-containing protein [Bacteroidota bacterium]